MKFLLLATTLLFATLSAFAKERVVTVDLFKNHDIFSIAARDLKIQDLSIVTLPKKIKMIDDENCGDFTSSCRYQVVLEKEKVVQLTMTFENNEWREEEDHTTTMKFNFPLASFSPVDLDRLNNLSNSWIYSRKKTLARKEMANRLFDLNLSVVNVTISVVDYERSTFCHEEDRYCRDNIVLKDKEITANKIVVTLK